MLILDTETTGLVTNSTTRLDKQPEVIEFCGIRIDKKGKVVEELDTLVKPTMPITDEITSMNNIDNAMIADAKSFKELASDIRDLIERSECVVAHNASFDCDMINLEFRRLGLTKIAWPRTICTIEQTVHLTGYRLSLSALYEHLFKEKFAGAHRAKADVVALIRIVTELRKRGEL